MLEAEGKNRAETPCFLDTEPWYSVSDMFLGGPETLLAQAKKSFAEVRSAFPGGPTTEIIADQDPPGEYRVQVTFFTDPAHPTLRILRFPKPNLAPPLTGEEADYPARVHRDFDAFSDGSQFGWLEHSASEPPLSSADVIGVVRGLL